MLNNKAAGPDGFPAKNSGSSVPHNVTGNIRKWQTTNKYEFCQRLLLKPGKDAVLPTSYCPISLIKVDMKIICKALSKKLEKKTSLIIYPDQTGFIKVINRYM